jgi:hypothetical protein
MLVSALVFTGVLSAQTPDGTQAQPAPIVRTQSAPPATLSRYTSYTTTLTAGQALSPTTGVASTQPDAGIYLRVAPNSSVRAVSTGPLKAEFKVERGLVNLSVHDPAKGQLILVDLPGGQVQPLKNGFYTFNAATNTVRVLKGEADAFAGTASDTKPVKVKEDHAVTFSGIQNAGKLRSIEFYPFDARTDIIPAPADYARASDGPRYAYPGYYGYGFYGGGYPYYPYSAWGYPYYGWGYPYGGIGFGFGFYGGGFYGGGFRGRR